jgi:hypothetical protein
MYNISTDQHCMVKHISSGQKQSQPDGVTLKVNYLVKGKLIRDASLTDVSIIL